MLSNTRVGSMDLPSAHRPAGWIFKKKRVTTTPGNDTLQCRAYTERQGCRVTITQFYSHLLYLSFSLLLPNWHKTSPVFVFVYLKPIESCRQQFKISSLLSFFIPNLQQMEVDINGQCHAVMVGNTPKERPHSLKQVSNCNTLQPTTF